MRNPKKGDRVVMCPPDRVNYGRGRIGTVVKYKSDMGWDYWYGDDNFADVLWDTGELQAKHISVIQPATKCVRCKYRLIQLAGECPNEVSERG